MPRVSVSFLREPLDLVRAKLQVLDYYYYFSLRFNPVCLREANQTQPN